MINLASIFDWLKSKFGSNIPLTGVTAAEMSEFWSMASSVYIRELAFRSCVSLVAKAVAKCEFKTFSLGKEVRGDIWYSWNVQPNRNQCSSVFLDKLVTKLFENNHALVVQMANGDMLVADSFNVEKFALKDYVFTNVTVDNLAFEKPFFMGDVLYFQLNNTDVRSLVNGLHQSYGQLLEYSQKAFKKSRGQKGVLNISAKAAGDAKFEATLTKLMNERFKPYFEADSAVLPLTDGYGYNEKESRIYAGDNTRDMRAQVDDVFVFTARAFGIQPALVLGELADTSKATDSLLTFCVDPLTDMLSEEINRKTYGKAVLKGNKLAIDTKAIKHIDLLAVAVAIDKLISSGAFCVNDIRSVVGEEPINEPWAYKHWMTRNYLPADEAMNQLGEGGENAQGV